NVDGWKFIGAGADATKLFSPHGVPSAQLTIQWPNAEVRQLEIEGNARDDGYTPPGLEKAPGLDAGLYFGSSHHSHVADVTITDCFQAIIPSFSDDLFAERVRSVMTQGKRQYLQWMFQWKDSTGGGCIDCSVESPTLLGGYETFKSYGTLFRGCTGLD